MIPRLAGAEARADPSATGVVARGVAIDERLGGATGRAAGAGGAAARGAGAAGAAAGRIVTGWGGGGDAARVGAATGGGADAAGLGGIASGAGAAPTGRGTGLIGVGIAARGGVEPTGGVGGAPSGARDCVVRGAGGASDGRIAAPGIGGVSEARTTGRDGTAGVAGGAGGGTGADGGVGATARGRGGSVIAGISRDARATTPGVNEGVGFCLTEGADAKGVAYGMEERPEGGVGAGAARGGIGGVGDRGAVGVAVVGRRAGIGAASASDSIAARSPASHAGVAFETVAVIPIRITAPQTEHRARIPTGGIFVGSTRNTELHSAHETFTAPPSLWLATPA